MKGISEIKSKPLFHKFSFSKEKLEKGWFAFSLFAPSCLILLFVIAYPLARSFWLSFNDYNLIMPWAQKFSGLNNYIKLYNDSVFWEALKNTLIFNVFSVLGGFFIGFGLALLLNQNIRFQRYFRGLLLTPWIIPYVVIGFLFLYMFNTKIGIVNYTFQALGIISDFLPWFADTDLAMTAVILANIWNQFPFYLTTILAGLQTVPKDCLEAARIDGANSVKAFWYITLPWLRNIIVICTTLMMIQNFNNFALIWSMTEGGPIHATTTFVIYVYEKAFVEFDFGYASTIGMVWMFLLIFFAYGYMKTIIREVN